MGNLSRSIKFLVFGAVFLITQNIYANSCRGIKNGDELTRVRYKKSRVSFDESCEQEVQKSKCVNGRMTKWTGQFKHIKCSFAAHIQLNDSNEKKIIRSKKNRNYMKNADLYEANDNTNDANYENLEGLISDVETDRNISSEEMNNFAKKSSSSSDVDSIEFKSDHPLDVDFQNDEYDQDDSYDTSDLESY